MVDKFSEELLNWFVHNGRHDLPWQQKRNAYRIWISEIMLQQTQVKTAIPYFDRFTRRFPDIISLAEASLDDVLQLWSGLGYYARARNLHRAARTIITDFGSKFPNELQELQSLPGIGRSTAGAILALSADRRFPILDGNVKRVLARYHGIDGWPGRKPVEDRLWQLAEQHTPLQRVAEYTQAIMDLGATVCTRSRPACMQCPVATGCVARQGSRQHLLPEKKPKKQLPVRQTLFTIIENPQGEILLHKRPPTGIWGGLWCLPECPENEDFRQWIKKNFGNGIESVNQENPFRHTFSHFHLDITPVRVKTRTESVSISDGGNSCWIRPEKASQLGMAAPIKKLIEGTLSRPANH